MPSAVTRYIVWRYSCVRYVVVQFGQDALRVGVITGLIVVDPGDGGTGNLGRACDEQASASP